MKILLIPVFMLFICYYVYWFVRILQKMKEEKLFPVSDEERLAIRKYPQKAVDIPVYSSQKTGIIAYSFLIIFFISVLILLVSNEEIDFSIFLLLLIPSLHVNDLFNMFAIVDDGVLDGRRFIPWKRIKSFQFVPIDLNHKYYGYEKEVNDSYELVLKTNFFSASCIVTSVEIKEKLGKLLLEHGIKEKAGGKENG